MVVTGETQVVRREVCLSATLSPTGTTWTGSGIEMRRLWFCTHRHSVLVTNIVFICNHHSRVFDLCHTL